MNCPSCSAPLLFGATCNCGSKGASADSRALELSYWEAFRAWWRIYWPTQVVSAVFIALLQWWQVASINQWRFEHPLEASPLEIYPQKYLTEVLSMVIGAACMWLFTPRILGRAYRGFRITACGSSGEIPKLHTGQRTRLRFFVWWRYFAGALLALLLAAPLNMMLGTMGIAAPSLVATLATLFGVGPVVMKMFIGSQLRDFRIEACRPVPVSAGAEATIHAEP